MGSGESAYMITSNSFPNSWHRYVWRDEPMWQTAARKYNQIKQINNKQMKEKKAKTTVDVAVVVVAAAVPQRVKFPNFMR